MINLVNIRSLTVRQRERYKGIMAILSLAAFFVIFFWRGIFGGEFFLISDPLNYSHPMRAVAWDMIRHGQLPLWTPLIFSGYPLLSMAQLGLGYPITWGYLFLPGPWAEQAYVLAPYLLAPIFTYAFARELGRSRLAALLAGLSFGYGGMMASWISNGLATNAALWLPLMLIAIRRAQTNRFGACFLGVTGAYSLSVLSGIGQFFTLVGIIALSYAVFLIAAFPRNDGGLSRPGWLAWPRWKPLVVTAGGMVAAAGVAAFQLIESWQAVRLSIRNSLSYELFSQLSFTPALAWRSFLAPIYNYVETTPYVLPLVALLALIATAAAIRHPRRDPEVFFWLIVAVIASLLILGPHTFLNRVAYSIPILNGFRGPSRHTFELTFSLSILGAYGWDAVADLTRSRSAKLSVTKHHGLKLAAGVAILIAIVLVGVLWTAATPKPGTYGGGDIARLEAQYLRWKAAYTCMVLIALALFSMVSALRAQSWLKAALALLVCFTEPNIICSRWWAFAGLPEARLTTISPVSRWLQKQIPEQNRVYTRVRLFAEQNTSSPVMDAPNISALAGLHNLAGYEPLISRRYSRALGDVWLDGVTPLSGSSPDHSLLEPQSHVLDLLNARFVVAYSNLAIDRGGPGEKWGNTFEKNEVLLESAGTQQGLKDNARWFLAHQEGGVIVLENKRALPRAWLVPNAEAVGENDALRRIRGEGGRPFDPRQTALLEIEAGAPPTLPTSSAADVAGNSRAQVVSYEPNRLVVETAAERPSVLVVSEINYPGWKALVDGAPAPIYQTDYLLRGLILTAGTHRIEMTYTPWTAQVGGAISLGTLALILALAEHARQSRYRQKKSATDKHESSQM